MSLRCLRRRAAAREEDADADAEMDQTIFGGGFNGGGFMPEGANGMENAGQTTGMPQVCARARPPDHGRGARARPGGADVGAFPPTDARRARRGGTRRRLPRSRRSRC